MLIVILFNIYIYIISIYIYIAAHSKNIGSIQVWGCKQRPLNPRPLSRNTQPDPTPSLKKKRPCNPSRFHPKTLVLPSALKPIANIFVVVTVINGVVVVVVVVLVFIFSCCCSCCDHHR